MPVISNEQCRDSYGSKIVDSTICAGTDTEGICYVSLYNNIDFFNNVNALITRYSVSSKLLSCTIMPFFSRKNKNFF